MEALLFPRTDAGVVVQVVVLAVLIGGALWLTRQHRDARLVVIGGSLLLVGLVGLRAAH